MAFGSEKTDGEDEQSSSRSSHLDLTLDVIHDVSGSTLNDDEINHIIATSLIMEGVSCASEISLTLCTDSAIQALNHEYRGKDSPTNVLSFPSLEPDDLDNAINWAHRGGPPVLLGDIVLSLETCAQEAKRDGKSLRDHISHLLVHATLHLLGFDHIRDDEAEEMEAREIAILRKFQIKNPYLDCDLVSPIPDPEKDP